MDVLPKQNKTKKNKNKTMLVYKLLLTVKLLWDKEG